MSKFFSDTSFGLSQAVREITDKAVTVDKAILEKIVRMCPCHNEDIQDRLIHTYM